jgi:hypothetical protein
MPASSSPPTLRIPAERLLPHVVEATAHAQAFGVFPQLAVNTLNAIAGKLMEAGQLDTSLPLYRRALAIAQEQLAPITPAR